MKKVFLFAVFFLVFLSVYAQTSLPPTGMEISFTYNRQRGFSSNQFAIWIEDSRGNFTKTIYATRFTASGGWARRSMSIPVWVEKSGLSSMARSEVDAFTGATPRAGTLSYSWDGRDKNGNPLPAGEYRVFLEATLREANRVLYCATFTLGSGNPIAADLKTEYFGSNIAERGMIGNVRVITNSK